MLMQATPPIDLSPVTDTVQGWQYLDAQLPVDFTTEVDGNTWSAEFILENCGCVLFRTPVSLFEDGGLEVTIPAGVSAALRSQRRIDGRYQIRFTAPVSDFDTVWHGAAVVLEITP